MGKECVFNDPVVISSIITVVGMLGTFAITQLSISRQRKSEVNERFFYELYPKRLAVYEKIKNRLIEMRKQTSIFSSMTHKELQNTISENLHDMLNLCHELYIFGNPETFGIASDFIKQAKSLPSIQFGSNEVGNKQEMLLHKARLDEIEVYVSGLVKLIDISLDSFTGSIKAEAGAHFFDNKIKNFIKKVGNKTFTSRPPR